MEEASNEREPETKCLNEKKFDPDVCILVREYQGQEASHLRSSNWGSLDMLTTTTLLEK